ncbi:MAG: oxaloacetate decarboxylase [Deltaproteobacteria bacterium]|nr:oxaloacetate decarboxylase [Deltaproteobacteria bacterium]
MSIPTTAERRKTFRQRLAQPGIVVAAGCYDAFSAKIADHVGFEALYMTGAGVSAAVAGAPDVGLLTMTEMVEQARRITDVTAIPLISDADTGYGGVLNITRTVRQFERAGVCAIHLEDQQIPKKCGHLEGKRIVPAADMIANLKAALDARSDPDLLIIARTDARAVHGMEDALDRARRYAEAGADILFVEAPVGMAEVETVARELTGLRPLLLNRGGADKTPPLSAAEADRLGFKIVIFPGDAQRAAGHAMRNIYRGLKESGNTKDLDEPMMGFAERFEILGMPEVRRLEAKYRAE